MGGSVNVDWRGRMKPAGWLHALRVALTPADARWAIIPGLGASVAVGVVGVVGAVAGHLQVVELAYFGAACAAVFVGRGPYRLRALALLGQAVGASIGLSVGAITHSAGGNIAVAVVVAFISGLVGPFGAPAAAGGFMAVIGVAFAQFGGSSLTWNEQVACYLIGTAAVAAVAVSPWLIRRDRPEREAVALVLTRSADLFELAGSSHAGPARAALAAATAAARDAVFSGRYTLRFSRRRRGGVVYSGWQYATEVALEAAATHAERHPRPERARAARAAAEGLLDGRGIGVAAPALAPPLRRTAGEIYTVALLGTAARIAWCMGIATAVTEALHDEDHSVWIALTVSVLVRPEYASVFVRTVNRLAGTVAGGVVAAAILLVADHGVPVAMFAAVSIGFAVAAAPKLYALSVLGVTCSALLSACIGSADPAYPAIRIADTALGAVIALLFGYLLWPGHGDPEPSMGVTAARRAAGEYLHAARDRAPLEQLRDRAYAAAHRARAIASSALLEPPPVADAAASALTQAIKLENTVDEITSLAARNNRGEDVASDVARLRDQLATTAVP